MASQLVNMAKWRRRWPQLKVFLGVFLTSISFFFLYKVSAGANFGAQGWRVDTAFVVIFVAGVFISIVGFLLLAVAWKLLIVSTGSDSQFAKLGVILGLSQIGKYIPGNVAQVVGRIYLSKNIVEPSSLVFSIVAESILLSAVALAVGLMLGVDIFDKLHSYSYSYSYSYFVIPLVGLFLLVLVALKYFFKRRFGRKCVTWRAVGGVSVIYVVSYLVHGFYIYLLLFLVFNSTDINYATCVGAFSMAFLVGYLLPGASGGLGVREFAFVLLIGAHAGEAEAIGAILFYRMVSICADVVVFCIAFIINKRLALV